MFYQNIRFILLQTTHPGNIGAAARAIQNMGFDRLVLVSPKDFPSEEATRRASGADHVLQNARVFSNFEEAIADCHLVFGLSGRERKITWPTLNPEQAAKNSIYFLEKCREGTMESREIMAEAEPFVASGEVAFVFGSEQTGLTNEQLEKCHYQVKIPANPEYFSLNLAQAVQIIAYELRKVVEAKNSHSNRSLNNSSHYREKTNKIKALSNTDLVSHFEMEGFYRQLEDTLLKIKFLDPIQSPHLMTYLRRLFNKAQIDKNELQILRGILTAVEKDV